ncbi:hypothetical protein MHU86_6455 [Fragilaria crotonensis]|nr:hypothetical protein MHU86_6455 [Fragilaria crotonensis]
MSSLHYEYAEHTLDILRPILFQNRGGNADDGDKDDNLENPDPWAQVISQLITTEIKHDVALCLLAEVLEDSAGVAVDSALDVCGPAACLVASSCILSDLGGSTTSSASTNLVTALPLVFRTIRRQYLTKPLDDADDVSHVPRD